MRPRDLLVTRSETLDGKVMAPGSKSVTHRALVISSLADGTSILRRALTCEDTLRTIKALEALGIETNTTDGEVEVVGKGGEFSVPNRTIDLGNSGTSLRFLTTLAGLVPGRSVLTGDESLRSRPMGDLLRSLSDLGVNAVSIEDTGCAPIEISGKGDIPGGSTDISGAISSQFVSSLLLASPYFEKGLDLRIQGELKSTPYVDLTVKVMGDFGAKVEVEGKTFHVDPGQGYSRRGYDVDGDYSSSSFLMAATAITGSNVEITGLRRDSRQADEIFTSILREMGCKLNRAGDAISVEGGQLKGVDVDLSNSPDLLPPVSVLASVASGPSRIEGVEHARHKESDRITAMHHELRRLGIGVNQSPDGLEFEGSCKPVGTEAFSWGDHRIAMALAVIGLISDGLIVRGASCISVSYPRFYDDMLALGAKLKWI